MSSEDNRPLGALSQSREKTKQDERKKKGIISQLKKGVLCVRDIPEEYKPEVIGKITNNTKNLIERKLADYELEDMWGAFGDIPIDDNDLIQQEFLGFPVGTNRMEVWKWFDEHYTDGVAKLAGLI
jgi:hypothetical protein